jgi:hypothetical protein
MSQPLPPDLRRLGDEIVAAAERDLRSRRRRRAASLTCAAAALAALMVGAGVPGVLAPAERTGDAPAIALAAAPPEHRPGCDLPRTATFAYPAACLRAREARRPAGPGAGPQRKVIRRRW